MWCLDLQELIAHADQILGGIGEEDPAFNLSLESFCPVQVDFIGPDGNDHLPVYVLRDGQIQGLFRISPDIDLIIL